MATYNPSLGARTALTITGFSTLASANYAVSAAINHDSAKEPNRFVEIEVATTAAPSGNKQILVFAKGSLDNTNWTSGPETGTDSSSEANLYFLGTIAVPTAGAPSERRIFDLAAAFGGRLPKGTKIVVKNDLGAALTTGNAWTVAAVDTVA